MGPVARNPGSDRNAARINGLYVLLDAQPRRGLSPLAIARAALEGGARMLQIREKILEKGLVLPLARDLRAVCDSFGALLFINDHADLALAAGAHGVHVGQKDLPVAEVRRFVPASMLVGASTNSLAEALAAQDAGANYVAVGSIFPTSTKGDTRPASPAVLREVKSRLSVPVVAIGGINEGNIDQVLEARADAVAVISAVVDAPDIRAAARKLSERIEAFMGKQI
jgi:thiamine-phosphate pyrophosphorylase